MLKQLVYESDDKIGLSMDTALTIIMLISENTPIIDSDKSTENVEEYKYLR